MFWALVFFGPIILTIMGAVGAGTGIKFIWEKPGKFMNWFAGLVLIVVGIAILSSGILLIEFVFSHLK